MKRILAFLCVCLMLAVVLTACDPSVPLDQTSTPITSTTVSSDPTDPDDPVTPTDPEYPTDPTNPEDPTTAPSGDGSSVTTLPSGSATQSHKPTNPPTGPTTWVTTVVTTASKATTTVTMAKEEIVNMNGYSFVLTSSWMVPESQASTLFEFQFFDRLHEVEEDYNCKITVSSLYADIATLKPYIQAGRKVADVLETTPHQYYPLAAAGYLTPWSKVSNVVNTADARWTPGYTKLGTFRDTVWGLQFMRPAEVRYCVVFNKSLLKSIGYDPDSLYSAVAAKTWDWDMMRSIAVDATKDTNNDGKNDMWGIIGEFNYFLSSIFWSNNARLAMIDTSGKAVCTVTSQEAVEAISFVDQLANVDKVYFVDEDYMRTAEGMNSAAYINYDWSGKFLEGKSAFLFYESWAINQKIRPAAKFDYGMLPIPMGPQADDYVSPAPYGRVFVMTSTNKTTDKTAIIFNAIARPLDGEAGLDYWEDVQGEYFQNNDTKSLDMYKLCLDKSMADPGSAVPELYFAFTHTSGWNCVLFQEASPAAALGVMVGQFDDIVDALYNQKL